jgi:hypothetical protein
MGVVIVHRWSCPTHGVLHSFRTDSTEGGTGEAAARIAAKANDSVYARGCVEQVDAVDLRGRRETRACAQRVVHVEERARP